jgi:neutral ceramidase
MKPPSIRIACRILLFALGLSFLPAVRAQNPAATPAWKVGVASVDITPDGPVWLAGFPKRTAPSTGVAIPIFAKGLALVDSAGSRMVIVTLDLVTIPRDVRQRVEREAGQKYGLRPESIMLNASHTHSAPALTREEVESPNAYFGTPVSTGLADKADVYRGVVGGKIVEVIGAALSALKPAALDYNHARAGFAMNRRLPSGTVVLHEAYPDGPVDHDVPVLRITGADGKVMAILFGYACHNTSVTTVCPLLNGDYAGYAQKDLQEDFPGALALFIQGAAGDQNPYPRGPLVYGERYGRALADAVEAALIVTVHHPVNGPLQSALGYAALPYAQTSRAELEQRTRVGDDQAKRRAAAWLKQLDSHQTLPVSYPCPVQVIRFGTDLTMIAIGGETTVEYSLRLKRELAKGPGAVWYAGYSNDVFGYLGSREVLEGGGYEGYETNAHSAVHPGPYALDTEDRVIAKVYDLIQQLNH